MSPAPPASSEPPAPTADAGTVRLAAAGYAAVLLAALVATAVVAVGGGVPTALVGAAAGAIGGGLAGWLVAGRVADLSIRLGSSWPRRWAPASPAVAFVALALGGVVGSLPAAVVPAGLFAALAIAVAGGVLARLAQNRCVERAVAGEPLARSRWEPSGSRRLDLGLLVLGLFLVGSNAVAGNWIQATVWVAFTLAWVAGSVNAGRLGSGIGAEPAVLIYESGIVRRRRFTATFVPWEDVAHARLRDGEIVVDWGLFDLRVDSADLADPDGLFDAIEDVGPMTIR